MKTLKKENNITKINSHDLNLMKWEESYPFILEFCRTNTVISNTELEIILNLNEKELTNTFLTEYDSFNTKNLKFIEKYVNNNLEHSNKEFVSDLIYFSVDKNLNLNSNYDKILDYLKRDDEDKDCIVLACLEYILYNTNLNFIEKIIKNLEHIRDNNFYDQSEQIIASFILFRISHKKEYLKFVNELILDAEDGHRTLINNILQNPIFSKDVFDTKELIDILILEKSE